MNDLLVLVPSRGRPENVSRLVEACLDTCQGDTTLVIGLDEDDPRLPEYFQGEDYARILTQDVKNLKLQFEVRSELHQVVAWINCLAISRVDQYRFIGTIGDDNVPTTEGWDLIVKRSLVRQGIGMCFGDDLYPRQKGSLCCHVFMDSRIIKTLGYMGPPSFQHMVDPVWMEWGKSTSIEFLPNVMMEHFHFSNGKSQPDETYLSADRFIGPDGEVFNQYCVDGLREDVRKIQALRDT